ncbi:MAG: TspO/MBR family protein [candidate division WOR-3 bacterium]|jgi:tryptophan-rich sensory protein|nr:tryptophan-rich sensory protein [candidate division WOR-3 bacterium]MDH7519690.1 tryptophan-rich sensory protein [bacterium]
MKGADIVKLIVSIALPLAAGALGNVATAPKIPNWYQSLNKPVFNPPRWLFGPAWTLLFILMGIALFLVWRKGFNAPGVKLALFVFLIQLALNVLWSFLFFGLRSPLAGLMEITILWLAILVTIILFFRVSVPAGVLLLPYIGWVTFATILNAAIVKLNP